MSRLVLASGSSYRRALLGRLGLPFETHTPAVDETPAHGEAPAELAARLAHAKALAASGAGLVVIGSDQVASLAGRILGKPGGHAAALEQLAACSGRSVDFHTAATVVDADTGREWHSTDHTRVQFRRRDRAALERYLEIEQPYDCAGGFKAEGLGICLFDRIESTDPTALIGLPLVFVARALAEAGLDPLGAR